MLQQWPGDLVDRALATRASASNHKHSHIAFARSERTGLRRTRLALAILGPSSRVRALAVTCADGSNWPSVQAAVAARAVGVLSYAWLATGFRPFSSGALLATVCAGLVVIGVGTRRRLPPPTPRRGVGASVWGVLAGTLAVWELASFLQHPRAHHPTLSSVANRALADHPARALGFVVWLGVGVVLSRR